MNIDFERIGLLVDRLDNLAAGLDLPMPDSIHVEAFRTIIPAIREDLKGALVEAGFNPWEDS